MYVTYMLTCMYQRTCNVILSVTRRLAQKQCNINPGLAAAISLRGCIRKLIECKEDGSEINPVNYWDTLITEREVSTGTAAAKSAR